MMYKANAYKQSVPEKCILLRGSLHVPLFLCMLCSPFNLCCLLEEIQGKWSTSKNVFSVEHILKHLLEHAAETSVSEKHYILLHSLWKQNGRVLWCCIAYGSLQWSKKIVKICLCWSGVRCKECLKVHALKNRGGRKKTADMVERGFLLTGNVCSTKPAEHELWSSNCVWERILLGSWGGRCTKLVNSCFKWRLRLVNRSLLSPV